MVMVLLYYLISLREKKLKEQLADGWSVKGEGERQLRICRRTYLKERVETRSVTFRLKAVIVLEQEECVG